MAHLRPQPPRSILITGASSGIGAALARRYARPGAHLALAGRDPGRLATIAAECRRAGAQVDEGCVDVTDRAAMAAWIGQGRPGCAARSGDRQRRHRGPASAIGTGTHPRDLRGQPRRRAQYHRAGRTAMAARGRGQLALMSLARQLLRLAERSRLLQQQGRPALARRRAAPAPRAAWHRGLGDLPRLHRDPDDWGHPSPPAVQDERRAGSE